MLSDNLSYIDMIKKLQYKTENIRNVCVLAHVDHGQIRLMDFRKDEQERCITMKSSSISIVFDSQKKQDNYLINLIDSPGHVDFTSEVSSALKLCDGALILIDVVEGICSQTESVLRQSWNEKIKCVLVLNKIDRLIFELQMDPLEAYIYLVNLLEKTNSLMGSLIVRDINLESENKLKYKQKHKDSSNDFLTRSESEEIVEIDIEALIQEKEEELYFSPDKGNVVFASAIDGWGFTLESFSEILTKTIGFKKEVITKLLWGDYYFNKSNKKIYKTPVNSNSKPMFVEFVLNNIYKLYKLALVEKNLEAITKAATTLNVEVLKSEINMFDKNPRGVLKTIMRQWLKLSNTVFEMAVEFLPDPKKGALNKFNVLFPTYMLESSNSIVKKFRKYLSNRNENQSIKKSIPKSTQNQEASENLTDNLVSQKHEEIESQRESEEKALELSAAPILAFISKMVPINVKNISDQIITNDMDQNEIKYMAFARAYCGSIVKGQEYYVIGPKHDPKANHYDIKKYKFDNLYLFMGQSLEAVIEVPPGNIFSVAGLENYVFKTATISSQFECPSIKPSLRDLNSIIKICIVTEDLKEMPILIEGLKKLNRSDPAVEYYVQKNGEHILVTSGEVHLERCIKDLEDHLAKVKFKISAPMVNFKEGLANTCYQFKKKNLLSEKEKENKKIEKVKDDEKKKDLNKRYVLDEGDKNIDLDDQKEILKSCTPMILMNEKPNVKKPEKVKNQVVDLKNKAEKTNYYIEKNVKLQKQMHMQGKGDNRKNADEDYERNKNSESKLFNNKGFSEDSTPNKLVNFIISAVGMNEDQIEFLEKNEELMREIVKRDFILSDQLHENFIIFKQSLLDLFEDKKLRGIIDKYLFCFGPQGSGKNMLLIQQIKPEKCYFNRIRKENYLEVHEKSESCNVNNETEEANSEIKDAENDTKTLITINSSNTTNNIHSNTVLKDDQASIVSGNISQKLKTNKNLNIKINKSNKKENIKSKEIEKSVEEDLLTIKNTITPNEFLNSVKAGFELALLNGPLCEEEMYGVIFILEEIKVNKEDKKKQTDNLDAASKDTEKTHKKEESSLNPENASPEVENLGSIKEENLEEVITRLDYSEKDLPDTEKNLIKLEEDLKNKNPNFFSPNIEGGNLININENKTADDDKSLSLNSKQFNLYGPFIGQITGTVKECCRKAFLNSEPRLYEALYLCLFQIRIESIGRIHSVINKRRGKILNELSNDEGIICTIEAQLPIVESFGFVEEIRTKSSGMANPMLQFFKWQMINIDPFYVPTTQEEIENFGVNIDTPNIAKNYINKVRIRKGLPIDEKIVKHADKQKNLAKKR